MVPILLLLILLQSDPTWWRTGVAGSTSNTTGATPMLRQAVPLVCRVGQSQMDVQYAAGQLPLAATRARMPGLHLSRLAVRLLRPRRRHVTLIELYLVPWRPSTA